MLVPEFVLEGLAIEQAILLLLELIVVEVEPNLLYLFQVGHSLRPCKGEQLRQPF